MKQAKRTLFSDPLSSFITSAGHFS